MLIPTCVRMIIFLLIIVSNSVYSNDNNAHGGVYLLGTRVVYINENKQASIFIKNSSKQNSYLIESWVEDSNKTKNENFIVTPPLYIMGPGDENSIKVINIKNTMNTDSEQLFYLVVKSIPSIDPKKLTEKNSVLVATANRIKMFVRPATLGVNVSSNGDKLTFNKNNDRVVISNPTPFFMTLTNLRVGNESFTGVMISPHGKHIINLKKNNQTLIEYNVIDDYGAISDTYKHKL